MSITPIEIAAMAPKSQEVSYYRHQESQRPLTEQAQISHQQNNQIQQNSRQTVKTAKTDNMEYRYDAKEKGNTSYSGNQKKKQKDKETNKPMMSKDSTHSGSIDIKI